MRSFLLLNLINTLVISFNSDHKFVKAYINLINQEIVLNEQKENNKIR